MSGVGQQNLPHGIWSRTNSPDCADLISGLFAFDDHLTLDARPGVVIERTYHSPNFFAGNIEHDTVIRFRHGSALSLLAN